MDRKWIVLAALIALTLAMGCKSAPPPPPPAPPPVVEAPPTTDVAPIAKPADPMDDTEKMPPKSLQDLQRDAEAAGLLGDVFYDYDKYDLRSDSRERLAKNADYMRANPGLTFSVEGHCDERGTNEYNIALGQSRAESAVDYLVSLGVGMSRFKTISYGEERPFCTESTERCWQKNRRARFVISGQ